MQRRAVFLDRDGVLNKAIIHEGKSYPPADVASLEFMPGAVETVRRIHNVGYLCICVTNQPDISRGTRTAESVAAINQKVVDALNLDDLFMCPHDNKDNCGCRKPKPGMLLAAAKKWNINITDSIMVGDRSSDMEAGFAAGCQTLFIPTPDITNQTIPPCTAVCNTLADVADFVEAYPKGVTVWIT
jgi:D-glycero-D-manno-heptose 1,7-bisphosphate phosphatase